MFKRLKNLWRLSNVRVVRSNELLSGTGSIYLEDDNKPKKKLAVILEDKPDLFPEQEPETI